MVENETKCTPINVFLDRESNQLLEEAIKYSSRTKRQEASIRLSDHLRRFGSSEFHRDTINESNKVGHVNVQLEEEDNVLIECSVAALGAITKREEAAARLKDHLRRYTGIAFRGSVVKR